MPCSRHEEQETLFCLLYVLLLVFCPFVSAFVNGFWPVDGKDAILNAMPYRLLCNGMLPLFVRVDAVHRYTTIGMVSIALASTCSSVRPCPLRWWKERERFPALFDPDRVSSPNSPAGKHGGIDTNIDLIVLGRCPQNTGIMG